MNILRRIWYRHRNKVVEKTKELLMKHLEELNERGFLDSYRVEPVIHPLTGEILTEYVEINLKWPDRLLEQIFITDVYSTFEVESFVKFLKKWHNNGYSYKMLYDAYYKG